MTKEWFLNLFSLFREIIGKTGNVAKETALAYGRLLYKAAVFSCLYLIFNIILLSFGVHFGIPAINGAVVLLMGLLGVVWVILAWPITMVLQYAPNRVKRSIRVTAKLAAGIILMSLLTTVYFYIVPVWNNPKLIPPILLALAALSYVYSRYGSMSPGAIKVAAFLTIGFMTFSLFVPNAKPKLEELGHQYVNRQVVSVVKNTRPRAQSEPKPVNVIPVEKKRAVRQQKSVFVPPPWPPITAVPEPEVIVVQQVKESKVPTLVVLQPVDLREFRRYSRQRRTIRRRSGGYNTTIDVFGADEKSLLRTLSAELNQALVKWSEDKDIDVIESAKNLGEMEAELRIGREREDNPLNNTETANWFLASSIGFQTEQVDHKSIGNNAGNAVTDFLPQKWRRRSRNILRNTGYTETKVKLTVTVMIRVYGRDRRTPLAITGEGNAEKVFRNLNVAGIFEKSDIDEDFLMVAVKNAVEDAISHLDLT